MGALTGFKARIFGGGEASPWGVGALPSPFFGIPDIWVHACNVGKENNA